MAKAGAAVRTATDAVVAAFWKSSFRPMRMGAVAVAGRTEVDRRGALGATNPLTAVRHTVKKARNFIIVVEGGVWSLSEGEVGTGR